MLAEPPCFVVNPEALPSLTAPVFGVCFSGRPPKALAKAKLAMPAGHPLRRTGGVIIVHTLINAKGQVVKAQILRDLPTFRMPWPDAFGSGASSRR